MLHINQLSINDKGFVNFKNKNWSANGDKSSWAQVRDNVLVINIATKGTITSEFEAELIELLSAYGVDSLYGMLGRHEFALDLSEEVVEVEEVQEVESNEETVVFDGQVYTLTSQADNTNKANCNNPWFAHAKDESGNKCKVVWDFPEEFDDVDVDCYPWENQEYIECVEF